MYRLRSAHTHTHTHTALTQHKDAQKPANHLFLKNAGTQRCWRAESENTLFKSFQKERTHFPESIKQAAGCWYIQYHYRLTLVKDYTVQPVLSVCIKSIYQMAFSVSHWYTLRAFYLTYNVLNLSPVRETTRCTKRQRHNIKEQCEICKITEKPL